MTAAAFQQQLQDAFKPYHCTCRTDRSDMSFLFTVYAEGGEAVIKKIKILLNSPRDLEDKYVQHLLLKRAKEITYACRQGKRAQ